MGITTQQYAEMLARVNRCTVRERPMAEDAEPREADLQEKISEECRRRGWIFVRSRMDRRTTTACGTHDYMILGDGGRTWLIEAKSRTGKLLFIY